MRGNRRDERRKTHPLPKKPDTIANCEKRSSRFTNETLTIEHRQPSPVAPPSEIDTAHVPPTKNDKPHPCTRAHEESPPDTVSTKSPGYAHATPAQDESIFLSSLQATTSDANATIFVERNNKMHIDFGISHQWISSVACVYDTGSGPI